MPVLKTPERLNYFTGQFLEEEDFKAEQAYHQAHSQLQNPMWRSGVILIDDDDRGLRVVRAKDAVSVLVRPGVGLDDNGRLLVVDSTQTVRLNGSRNQTLAIAISFGEEERKTARYGTKLEPTRVLEKPKFSCIPFDPKGQPVLPDGGLILASVTVDEKGEVVGEPEDRRFYARPRGAGPSGWLRLPFVPKGYYPDRKGAEERPAFEMRLGGRAIRAESGDRGAYGCIEIPVPPSARWIEALKIAGEFIAPVKITLWIIDADLGLTTVFPEREIRDLRGPYECNADYHLADDDALLLTVEATGPSKLHFVAAKFD